MTSAIAATAQITILDNSAIQDGVDTLTVGGVTYTFVSGSASPTEIRIEATDALTAANIAIRISTDVLTTFCTGSASLADVALTAATAGTTGNSISLSSTALTSTLTVTAFSGGLAATSTSYATIDDLKARVSLTTAEHNDDTWIQQLLDAASRAVDAYTRSYLPGYEAFTAIDADETRYYDDDIQRGWVDIDDCISITTVERSGVVQDTQFYRLGPPNRGNGPITQVIWSINRFPVLNLYYGAQYPHIGVQQIAITGKFGYCAAADRPEVVREAVLRTAEWWYEASQLSPADRGAMIVNPARQLSDEVKNVLQSVKKPPRLG
jgi:hypothetical protein